jgi:GNAT superfamily N-acetyltransferase
MPTEITLDDNLVLRSLRSDADKERFAVFNATFNNPFEGATCACLMHHYPETSLDDYWLVEDPSSGEVVSTTCLLPWVCRFDGIDLRVAQLEMVLTHPAYRGRGLVRAQMKHFEQVVLERGYDLSIISGIPNYYRQFGYAYAIDGDRCEALPVWKIPDHPPGVGQPLRLRKARSTDILLLDAGYTGGTSALNIAIRRTSAHWQYLLEAAQHHVEMVENAQTGETLGYVTLLRDDEPITILENGLVEAVDCLRLLLHLKAQACRQVLVYGSPYTPLVQLAHSLGSQVVQSTQWLLRFPDLARFLVRIGPVMENRLAGSAWRGLNIELIVNLYRQAFRLRFQSGRLAGVDSLGFVDASMGADGGHLCIPPEAFVRLVSGYRALEALFDAWPDIVVKPEVRYLIDVLFPPLKAYLYTPYHYLGKI